MNPEDPNQTVLCACGCGTPIPSINKIGKPAQFAHGHNRRGADVKPETRAKLSARTADRMHRLYGPPKKPWMRFRGNAAYKEWRTAVLRRDDYTCQRCGAKLRSIFLHAHHIESWMARPDLRFTVENGLTVCVPCHNKIHGWKTGVEPEPCACGCGELCDPRYKFLRGHWTRVRKGEFTRTGKTNSPETRRKISEVLTGTIFTPERKANISKAKKGKPRKTGPLSEQHKANLGSTKKKQYENPAFAAKMGEAIRKGKAAKRPPEGPPVPCECGCGTMLPALNSIGKPSRFVRGHGQKGRTVSDATRAKMSSSARNRHDPSPT